MSRIAVINREKCHPDECGNLCLKKCPINKMGDECIIIDSETNKARIVEELCVGCGICPRVCPYGAINIINLPEELRTTPIHRYGENLFALFNLPVPVFGKVVGLIGRNGIGKSTAMKILAGVLNPNFEKFSGSKPNNKNIDENEIKTKTTNPNKKLGKKKQVFDDATYRELINYFKGTEAQAYFEKLQKGEITISFKPQQIELIPKNFDGTVNDLLQRVNEKDEFEKIVDLLELRNILARDIKQISGGELQRVAIAACVLKKANVYFFDEPTSYLDIKQRLKVAKFIQELADENNAVMVIEHDLIILDYLTDFIHLIYGKESVYGVVSQLKATKSGINTYLGGYLREENVRFRDHAIKFDRGIQDEEISQYELVKWSEFQEKLGTFSLDVKEGTIFKNDIIGILGENGIGKTSFVKELVNASKEKNGILSTNETIKELTVAYKPQYIEAEDEVVRIYLKDALKYDLQIIKPMQIDGLLDLNLRDLSGGELQRVVIARTISQDAHIYMLDEPSAYLDVEQRLILSKVIRNMMEIKRASALIVDHDLLFIDYISKRLLVFEGTPAISGSVTGPFSMVKGMYNFLVDLDITFRRDESNNRPRVNKRESQKDKEQKASGNLYYS